ncbi:cytochrome P450 [Nocardia seriolae]|nr:cytochrome P450 [Nocardia seriolae]MTJ71362.1 cytochrome P450 [Nocardia seriolae]MTJ86534.1 cytochrome P450 [Nocardia seriolae]MTK30529.1 cytochrome P450 [Nocardia seriolae]MTK39475.1 cytochrome P450 [Nocardia seriolae]
MTLPPFTLTDWEAADIENPYPVYRRYREVAPVHFGADRSYYLLGHDAVAAVLSDRTFGRRAPDSGSAAPMVSGRHSALRTMVENWLVFLDPPRHTRLRSVISREFSPPLVAGLRDRIAEIAASLLADCAGKAEFDLVQAFSAPLPILVISELLGVPAADWEWLRNRAVAVQEASSVRAAARGADAFRIADAAAGELAGYFLSLAAERRRTPGADLVSLLVGASLHGTALSAEEIASTCAHLMMAGHETTTNVLGKSVLALAAHPDALAAVRAGGGLSSAAVEELVRFDGPVQAVTRWAYADARVGGVDIPRGAKVVAVLGAANRDPAHFPDPDVLLLDRRAGRNVGFGLGIHYCLGAALARAELEIGLGLLLRALGEFTVTSVEFPNDMVFHGPSALWLRRRLE